MRLWLVALVLLGLAGIGFYASAQQKSDTQMPPAPAPQGMIKAAPGAKTSAGLITDAPIRGDYVLGKKSAPITMVEYASLSCPHCAHFSNTVLPILEKNYIETGKLLYILRPFPLNEPALRAAMLDDCVGEKDSAKYYTFAKVMFDAQNKWAFDGNYMQGLQTIASVGGVSPQDFQACVNDKDREMKILKIKKAANDDLKIPATPTIYIENEMYEGDRSPEAISAFLDAKLATKK